jgi:geranylgeranyl reductase family protein
MLDVAIIGGGPGGLFAAICLARAGFSVSVLEEHVIPGEPVHCTGILAAEAYTEFDLPASAILNELNSLRLFSPGGKVISYTTETAHALVIDRRHFDQTISMQARDAGVQMIHDCKVEAVRSSYDGVYVDVRGLPSIRARACILACGANYKLQRKLGMGLPALFLRTAQVEVPVREPQSSVEIHFGVDIAPHGFAWAVPVRRPSGACARIGLMSRRNPEAFFERFLNKIRDRWGIEESQHQRPRLKVLPMAPIRRTYMDRLLVIGDAAGIVKPTTGGGIYYTILSASLATDVLCAALKKDDLSAAFLQKYEHTWRDRLNDELEAQLRLRKLAQTLADEDIERLFDLAQSDGIIPLIRSTARFNQHRELIVALLKHPQAGKILQRHIRS